MKTKKPEDDALYEEAMRWVFEADDRSAEDEAKFQQWLAESETHRRAYEYVEQRWREFDGLKELTEGKPDPDVIDRWIAQHRRRSVWRFAPAAAAAVVAASAILWWSGLPTTPNRYETMIGERATVELADGSTMSLNTNSVAEIGFSDEQRRIALHRGEAHFLVAHDPERAFIVTAGPSLVRAVGTAFAVRLREEGRAEVTVTEGVVEVMAAPPVETDDRPERSRERAEPLTVAEGQRAQIAERVESVTTVVPETLERELAWRDGMLVFDGEPLRTVVEEISRYTRRQIVIADPSLEEISVVARLSTDDPDRLLALIDSNDLVRVRRLGNDIVYLERP